MLHNYYLFCIWEHQIWGHFPTYIFIWTPQLTGSLFSSKIGSWLYDPRDETFVRLEDTNCAHYNGGCAIFYSPKHLNRPAVFVGGSRGSSGESCAEVLTYPWESNTWEMRKFMFWWTRPFNWLKLHVNVLSSCTVVSNAYTDNGKKLRNFFIREFSAESIVKCNRAGNCYNHYGNFSQ